MAHDRTDCHVGFPIGPYLEVLIYPLIEEASDGQRASYQNVSASRDGAIDGTSRRVNGSTRGSRGQRLSRNDERRFVSLSPANWRSLCCGVPSTGVRSWTATYSTAKASM